MGYCTRYDGEIKLNNNKVKIFIEKILLDDTDCVGDMTDWDMTLFESELKDDKLILNEDRKNYNEEMEQILNTILHYDNKATGEIIAEGEDGENKERIILKDGKLFTEEGFIDYRNPKDITEYETEDYEELDEDLERFDDSKCCEKCSKVINPKFIFNRRGYHEEITEATKYKEICQKCYDKLKEPFAKKRKIEQELRAVDSEIEKFAKGGLDE